MCGKKTRPEGYGLPEGPFTEFIRGKKTGAWIPNCHANQRRPLLVGGRFLSGMILNRHKKQHRKNDPSCNGGSRLSGTSCRSIIFTKLQSMESVRNRGE